MQYGTPQSGSKPMLSLPGAIKQCLRKYGDFSGRATRAEYWWLALVLIIAPFILDILLLPVVTALFILGIPHLPFYWLSFLINSIFHLATFLPLLAVTARRLHDINRTGWWQTPWWGIFVIPGIPLAIAYPGLSYGIFLSESWPPPFSGEPSLGAVVGRLILVAAPLPVIIWQVLWLARPGPAGPNRYGPDPRAI